MAKFRNINHTAFERAHFLRIERYARAVERIYAEAVKELATLATGVNFNPNKPFSFADYPGAYQKSKSIFSQMAGSVTATVLRGDKEEWLAAASNNDRLVEAISSTSRVQRKLLEQYRDRNLEALTAFQNRKTDGMGLSDRIWKQTQQFKGEMEMGIDLGLGDGRSAAQLSRDLRSYLKEPDKLFRRVRDKHGALHLSRAAQAYNPGQGVYRSSYKNAMRLTRTEINMAYRESDYHRWQEMDFIVGFEVRLSNNPNHCPMCAQLAGRYPKDFKFTGWHPHCRCRAIPIMKTDEEMDSDMERILNDDPPLPADQSGNAVKAMPEGYNQWMQDNDERIKNAKSTPYFIRDNYKGGNVGKGLRFDVEGPVAKTAINRIPERLANYTESLSVKVDESIFAHLKEPVEMTTKGKGAYYDPNNKIVNISIDDRRKKSPWGAESVVYHEYGHALDAQYGMRHSKDVKSLISKYRTSYGKDGSAGYIELDKKLRELVFPAYRDKKFDDLEQIGATMDTLMSLNKNFGAGHSKKYFSIKGKSEAEFLAHAFENKFKGNPIFKRLAPDLYDDMVKLVENLLKPE